MTMQEDLLELARLKENITSLQEDYRELEAQLVSQLESAGNKSVSANNGDLTGTVVRGTTLSYDEDGIKRSLGATLWKKVTKQVMDKEKLEAAIVVGDIDPNIIAQHTTEKDKKPYIRVTGTFRQKKTARKTTQPKVAVRNSTGGTKPAAKKRVVRRKP